MSDQPDTQQENAYWRKFLTDGDPAERARRRVYRLLPRGPRCGLCLAPFAGPGSVLMRMLGKRPAPQNPAVCTSCFTHMAELRGGAEIEMTLLFADIRGSTSIAEGMTPAEFRGLLDRFYASAADAVFGADGMIDKFVGDEVVAYFVPGFLVNSSAHSRSAVKAATRLLELTGYGQPGGPWVPIGAGIHTGQAWMGSVGEGARTELTAVGDTVNVAARLAAAAEPGEILVSTDAAAAAALDRDLPRRRLNLKGKAEPVEAISLTRPD